MAEIIHYPEIDLDDVGLICIDIDDTLYLYERCHKLALAACDECFTADGFPRPECFRENYLRHRADVAERLAPQGACRSRLLVFMGMFEELALRTPYLRAVRYDRLYWDIFIEAMYPEEQALRLLQNAFNRNIPVAAITDMLTEVQARKIAKLGMERLITYLVTSEEAGAEKPAPAIFRLALDKAGTTPDKAIMVGDSLSKDKAGAENMGIRFYMVRKIDV